jgi:hypothetical protein
MWRSAGVRGCDKIAAPCSPFLCLSARHCTSIVRPYLKFQVTARRCGLAARPISRMLSASATAHQVAHAPLE